MAAADDAGAVLSILARMDEEARQAIASASPDGKRLLGHLMEREESFESPKASASVAAFGGGDGGGGGGGGGGGRFFGSNGGGGGGGTNSDSSMLLASSPPPSSPGQQSAIRRCISGEAMVTAFERLETK